MSPPLIGLSARRLSVGRVQGWAGAGIGERDGYFARVRAAGGLAVMLDPNGAEDGDASELVGRLDAIVLTGGPDVEPGRYGQTPHETVYGTDAVVDDFETTLALAAIDRGVPVLGVCRGLQVLNVALGGSLHQHITELAGVDRHGRPGERDGELHHEVALEPGSRIAGIMGTTRPVCSCHHHQSIDTAASALRVVGRAADGIVEAVEATDAEAFVVAVQWHPEDTAAHDPHQQALFDAVVDAARARRADRR